MPNRKRIFHMVTICDCIRNMQNIDTQKQARTNEYARVRRRVDDAPSEFWSPIALSELHWFRAGRPAWLSRMAGKPWIGWHAVTAAPMQFSEEWQAWAVALHEAHSSVVRWFDWYNCRTLYG